MSLTIDGLVPGLAARPRPQWSVASTLTTLVVGLILVLMATTTIVDVRRERSNFREGLEQRGNLIARTLNDVLFDPLYLTDVDALGDIATVLKSQPDILYLQIFRRDGEIVVDTAQGDYAIGRMDDEFVASALDHQRTVFRSQNGSFEITTAIGTEGSQPIGGFRFGFSKEAIDAEIRAITVQRIWQSAALVLVGAVIAILISRQAAKPLKKLAAIAGEMGQGKLDTPVKVRGPAEIVSLGNALETMRVDLRRLYSGLEQIVAERTRELSSTNQELKKEVSRRVRAVGALRQQIVLRLSPRATEFRYGQRTWHDAENLPKKPRKQ